MINKVVRKSSKCGNCVSEKSRFLKKSLNKKRSLDKLNTKSFIY